MDDQPARRSTIGSMIRSSVNEGQATASDDPRHNRFLERFFKPVTARKQLRTVVRDFAKHSTLQEQQRFFSQYSEEALNVVIATTEQYESLKKHNKRTLLQQTKKIVFEDWVHVFTLARLIIFFGGGLFARTENAHLRNKLLGWLKKVVHPANHREVRLEGATLLLQWCTSLAFHSGWPLSPPPRRSCTGAAAAGQAEQPPPQEQEKTAVEETPVPELLEAVIEMLNQVIMLDLTQMALGLQRRFRSTAADGQGGNADAEDRPLVDYDRAFWSEEPLQALAFPSDVPQNDDEIFDRVLKFSVEGFSHPGSMQRTLLVPIPQHFAIWCSLFTLLLEPTVSATSRALAGNLVPVITASLESTEKRPRGFSGGGVLRTGRANRASSSAGQSTADSNRPTSAHVSVQKKMPVNAQWGLHLWLQQVFQSDSLADVLCQTPRRFHFLHAVVAEVFRTAEFSERGVVLLTDTISWLLWMVMHENDWVAPLKAIRDDLLMFWTKQVGEVFMMTSSQANVKSHEQVVGAGFSFLATVVDRVHSLECFKPLERQLVSVGCAAFFSAKPSSPLKGFSTTLVTLLCKMTVGRAKIETSDATVTLPSISPQIVSWLVNPQDTTGLALSFLSTWKGTLLALARNLAVEVLVLSGVVSVKAAASKLLERITERLDHTFVAADHDNASVAEMQAWLNAQDLTGSQTLRCFQWVIDLVPAAALEQLNEERHMLAVDAINAPLRLWVGFSAVPGFRKVDSEPEFVAEACEQLRSSSAALLSMVTQWVYHAIRPRTDQRSVMQSQERFLLTVALFHTPRMRGTLPPELNCRNCGVMTTILNKDAPHVLKEAEAVILDRPADALDPDTVAARNSAKLTIRVVVTAMETLSSANMDSAQAVLQPLLWAAHLVQTSPAANESDFEKALLAVCKLCGMCRDAVPPPPERPKVSRPRRATRLARADPDEARPAPDAATEAPTDKQGAPPLVAAGVVLGSLMVQAVERSTASSELQTRCLRGLAHLVAEVIANGDKDLTVHARSWIATIRRKCFSAVSTVFIAAIDSLTGLAALHEFAGFKECATPNDVITEVLLLTTKIIQSRVRNEGYLEWTSDQTVEVVQAAMNCIASWLGVVPEIMEDDMVQMKVCYIIAESRRIVPTTAVDTRILGSVKHIMNQLILRRELIASENDECRREPAMHAAASGFEHLRVNTSEPDKMPSFAVLMERNIIHVDERASKAYCFSVRDSSGVHHTLSRQVQAQLSAARSSSLVRSAPL